jgi:hypothetical protein
MPYIFKDLRDGAKTDPRSPGELNFAFTNLIKTYINNVGWRYATANDIIGALEACKLEFYRRQVAPYEDVKIKENGDVY